MASKIKVDTLETANGTGSITLNNPIAGFTSTGIDDNATSTAITIDASENVGVGVTPEAWSTTGVVQVGRVSLTGTPSAIGGSLNWNAYYNSGWKYKDSLEAGSMTLDNATFTFKVAPSGTADAAITWTDAIKIDNTGRTNLGTGNNLGATTLCVESDTGGSVRGPNPLAVSNTRASASTDYSIIFYRAGSIVGSVQTSLTATSFVTSSDYRLKENVTPMSGATAQTKLLKPCNFDWIAGGNVNGFLAHELAEVVPEAVTGTKDAMMDEEYEVTAATDTEAAVMGTRSVPDLQGIDQAKLVPLLTATIQELIARIEALEGE
jgi:hypothetical protein